MEFNVKEVTDKKIKKRNEAGTLITKYVYSVKFVSTEIGDDEKPLHKMTLTTDSDQFECGDTYEMGMSGKQTKLTGEKKK